MKKSLLLYFSFLIIPGLFGQAYQLDPVEMDSQLVAQANNVVSEIKIIGNKLTKDYIILREMTFNVGDTLENEVFVQELEQSKKNILNTSLFNFTKMELAYSDSIHVVVYIQVVERWYIFPIPIFEIDDNNFNTWWQDRDLSRINYGMNVIHRNVRGRKERLGVMAKFGFSERLRLTYSIPYINKQRRSGMSFGLSYNRKDEIVYTTFRNKRLLYKNEDRDAIRNLSAGVTYSYRKKIFEWHSVGIEFDYNSIVDSVRILNPEYLGDNKQKSQFFSLTYAYTNDRRDSRNYPLKGSLFNVNIKKFGLGINSSPVDLLNLQLQYRKYIPLKERIYAAASFRGVLAANDNQPYLLRNGLGYNSFMIRSYELFVIDGQNIALGKAQVRYQLVKPRDWDIQFMPQQFGKFHFAMYVGIFADAAYVEDQFGYPDNNLANELQYGSGIGIDFVTYYDFVLRTEFSMNKFGQSGLFFHFVAPI